MIATDSPHRYLPPWWWFGRLVFSSLEKSNPSDTWACLWSARLLSFRWQGICWPSGHKTHTTGFVLYGFPARKCVCSEPFEIQTQQPLPNCLCPLERRDGSRGCNVTSITRIKFVSVQCTAVQFPISKFFFNWLCFNVTLHAFWTHCEQVYLFSNERDDSNISRFWEQTFLPDVGAVKLT